MLCALCGYAFVLFISASSEAKAQPAVESKHKVEAKEMA